MDRACRLAQAGDVADELWCELYFQTVADPSVAPEGRHVMSAFCQYVPYGWPRATGTRAATRWPTASSARSSASPPASASSWSSARRSAPPDVERKIGLTGGHIFQGECLPEFMWDRRLALPHRRRRASTCAAPARTRAAA